MKKPLPTGARIAIGTALVLATLAVLRHKPWQSPPPPPPPTSHGSLDVGFLPVTCHLTCPVTDFATKHTTTGTRFVSQRYMDFPTVVEALKAKRLSATFLLAPLAMVLRAQGVPIKIVYLGHRDGSTVIVPKSSKARSLRDLRGKTFARPSRYSNQYLVITKLMEDEGMKPDEIKFIDLPPPDMPAALAAGAIDAYFVGEPHAAKSELAGTGRVLYHAKDIWPGFISCVLVVREDLIARHPEMVADLVRGIAESGEWAEQHRLDAARLVAPYYRQDQGLLEYVLTQPPDRVSYRTLTPSDDDMKKIMHYAIKAGILDKEVPLDELLDRHFIPPEIHAAEIDPSRPSQPPPDPVPAAAPTPAAPPAPVIDAAPAADPLCDVLGQIAADAPRFEHIRSDTIIPDEHPAYVSSLRLDGAEIGVYPHGLARVEVRVLHQDRAGFDRLVTRVAACPLVAGWQRRDLTDAIAVSFKPPPGGAATDIFIRFDATIDWVTIHVRP